MLYNYSIFVNCIENRKNYKLCPDKLHSHKVLFTLTLEVANVVDEEEFLGVLKDSISETIFLDSSWSLKFLAETMLSEMIHLEYKVARIKAKLEEFPLEFEITNV